MKWFKHDTDAFMSEGVDALIEQTGFEGYGRWCRILEMIAFKMDETDRCSVEYSEQYWRKMLGIYRTTSLLDYLKILTELFSISVESNGNLICISIPNLLKKRDKYTKDLQKKGKQLTPKIKIEEVDVEVDKEKKKIYGKFNNVKLTDEELGKLQEKFTISGATEWIETLSKGMALKTYKYKSHYLAILKWSNNKDSGELTHEERKKRFMEG